MHEKLDLEILPAYQKFKHHIPHQKCFIKDFAYSCHSGPVILTVLLCENDVNNNTDLTDFSYLGQVTLEKQIGLMYLKTLSGQINKYIHKPRL